MPKQREALKVVFISDTHGFHEQVDVPHGDVLIHSGDFTRMGEPEEIIAFNAWLGRLPHRHKIVIAGNHDFGFERDPTLARSLMTNCTYLQDQLVEVEGLRIYGTPWQPRFFNWAFNLDRGEEILKKWKMIPAGIDILVSHGPPLGRGDLTAGRENVGCADLLREVTQRIKPRYHALGHIHEAYGVTTDGVTTYVNASTCNLAYQPVNPPVAMDIKVLEVRA